MSGNIKRRVENMEYTTQMDAARKGIITKELASVAKSEGMDEQELRELVSCGQAEIGRAHV